MTRKDLIEKGEEQLGYILNRMEKASGKDAKNTWATIGVNMLDMLFKLLDEHYDKYDFWFNAFFYYDCK